MFTQPERSKRGWRVSLLVSFALHCLALYLLLPVVHPIFVTPSSVAFGHGGTSTELVYLSRQGAETSRAAASEAAAAKRLAWRARHAQKPRKAPSSVQTSRTSAADTAAVRAGSPYGSLLNGPLTGHDVKPALPVIFADPAISRSEIPAGVEGNVIVEITIDAQGIVTETKVLQGLGHGIEEKVVAAVRNWRFRPATMDGIAIPSQQDVYFHFPS